MNAAEEQLALHLITTGLKWEREYRFARDRRWKADFALPAFKIAIECEGGAWLGSKGGHTSGPGFISNMEKYNRMTVDGWKLLRFTPDQIKKGIALQQINELLKQCGHSKSELKRISIMKGGD